MKVNNINVKNVRDLCKKKKYALILSNQQHTCILEVKIHKNYVKHVIKQNIPKKIAILKKNKWNHKKI